MTTAAAYGAEFQGLGEIRRHHVGACALCGGGELVDFASGHDYELRTCSNLWVFRRCVGCGHVQLDPRPAVEDLGTIYPPTYYSYALSKTVSPIALKGKEILDGLKFRAILRSLERRPSSFLDIGCGDGRYLRMMAGRFGLDRKDVHGLELDAATVADLRGQGFDVHRERVESCARIAPQSISLATMFHVIEHVADPHAVVAKVAGWLEPGGVLAIETPNLDALDARLFRRHLWGGYHIPRHWHLFTVATLSRLLRAHGIEPTHVAYQTGHSFWMYSIHHFLRYRLGLPALARLFDPMTGLAALVAFTGIDKLRAALGFKTSAVLVVGRKTGRRQDGVHHCVP